MYVQESFIPQIRAAVGSSYQSIAFKVNEEKRKGSLFLCLLKVCVI